LLEISQLALDARAREPSISDRKREEKKKKERKKEEKKTQVLRVY